MERDSTSSRTELEALHAAVLRHQREKATVGNLIPLHEWEGMLARTLNVMTRQTAADKTWAMTRLGLIQHRKREGVIILEVNT